MADRPILFSGPMVRALIDGRKTQTRRILKIRGHKEFSEFAPSDTEGYDWHFRDQQKRWHDYRHADLLKRLPFQNGDRLYVREHWRTDRSLDGQAPRDMPADTKVRYEADHPWVSLGRFRQGMHMPRWASRITLLVDGVKVERLQDCSEADAKAEGVDDRDAVCGYSELWDAINGPGAWEENPWVCAVSFTVHKHHIGQLPKQAHGEGR